MSSVEHSLSISDFSPRPQKRIEWVSTVFIASGVLVLLYAWFLGFKGDSLPWGSGFLFYAIFSIIAGTTVYSIAKYLHLPPGIKNDGVQTDAFMSRGLLGWLTASILTLFYCVLYWKSSWIGYQNGVDGANTGLIALFDPLKKMISGNPAAAASQWFVYGSLYSMIILAMGVKFILKYRHNRYQVLRTISVMVAQLFFAYLIPEIIEGLNYNSAVNGAGEYLGWYDTDFKNTWPLDYDFFNAWHLDAMQAEEYQPLGMIYLVWGILLFTIVTPIITYFVGKRWYCSWVCGCGGLAETAGDPWRHLSSKTLKSWNIERWLIHSVLVLVVIMTIATLYGYFSGSQEFLGLNIYEYYQKPYGFVIGAAFSGVIGVGFYPLLGSRVWCRFGCPMAAYMGIIQRFKSRFRITTNGGQCISCGNCSTYCEMGIDVRWYAQRGENIVRASCVGCGVCSAVCPRGVLKLENGPEEGRISEGPINMSDGFPRLNMD